MIWRPLLSCLFAVAACGSTLRAETPATLPASLPGKWTYYGRGEVKTTRDTATLQEGFAATAEPLQDSVTTITARAGRLRRGANLGRGTRA